MEGKKIRHPIGLNFPAESRRLDNPMIDEISKRIIKAETPQPLYSQRMESLLLFCSSERDR